MDDDVKVCARTAAGARTSATTKVFRSRVVFACNEAVAPADSVDQKSAHLILMGWVERERERERRGDVRRMKTHGNRSDDLGKDGRGYPWSNRPARMNMVSYI